MKRYTLIACCVVLVACDDPKTPPSPSPETKEKVVQAPEPKETPKPEVPRRPMAEICREELAPHWGKDPESLWKSLDQLSTQCKGDSFCDGEKGFVSIITGARKEGHPSAACMGCHATWRTGWQKEGKGPGVHFGAPLH